MSFYRLDDDRILDAQEQDRAPSETRAARWAAKAAEKAVEETILCACGDTFPDGAGVRIGGLFICPQCAKEHPVLVGELQAALQADEGRDS